MSCLAELCPNVAQPVSEAVSLSDEPRYRAAIIAKYLVKLNSNSTTYRCLQNKIL